MKTAHDHAGFAEESAKNKRISEKLAELTAEQQEIHAQLRFKEPKELKVPTVLDRTQAILDGKPIPGDRTGIIDSLQKRELEIRGQIEILSAAQRTQPGVVEHERTKARAAALALRKKEIDGIWSAWDKARDALRIALKAEDALVNELLAGGFGRAAANITNPDWLNREAAIIDLKA
jgi:hypothetical protein